MTTSSDDPPESDDGPGPDMLRGYKDAGAAFAAVLTDAERRLIMAPDALFGFNARFGDIRVHTQYRQDYADPKEKERIIRTADHMLAQTVLVKNPPSAQDRFEEALAAMRIEDERVFVCTILGSVWDFVYWNWRYGYTLDSQSTATGMKRFTTDLRYRRVASPALAKQRYGEAVLRTADNNGRIPDFPVTRSHPPASWPSAANSSICRTYRKTAGEESRRRSPVANRWMRP